MIIFLHGDDTFRSREKLRELREKFFREVDPGGTNLVTIDGTTASASEVWGAIAAQSFLVRKRMVVVERIGAQKSSGAREEVAALLEKIPDDVIAVFWEEQSRNAERKTQKSKRKSQNAKRSTGPSNSKNAAKKGDDFFALLQKRADFAQEFAPLEGVALTRWVVGAAKALGATITSDATRDLIAIVGSDLWRTRNEIEKLALATAGTPITSAMVCDLVATVPEEDIFGFVDALGRGDRATAIRILRILEAARADPQYLLAMIHRQLRLLVMAADCFERGVPASQLAVELGVHPYVAQKVAQQARTASLTSIRALYPRLLDFDRQLKSSRCPWEALVELFCIEATAARM